MGHTEGSKGHEDEPTDVYKAGAPAYSGRAVDPDVQFDASGLPFIGRRPSARHPAAQQARQVSLPVQKWALVWLDEGDARKSGMWVAEGEVNYSLIVGEKGLALEEVVRDARKARAQQLAENVEAVKASPAPVATLRYLTFDATLPPQIEVKRWLTPQEGSDVVISCAFKSSADVPRSVLLFELDVCHASDFSPLDLEHIKAYFLSWQQKYGFAAEIDPTCALAIPPAGVRLATRIPPPDVSYDPLDSSTWVAPFPPVSEEQLKLYEDMSVTPPPKEGNKADETEESGYDGAKGKKRARKITSGGGTTKAPAASSVKNKGAIGKNVKVPGPHPNGRSRRQQADDNREQELLEAAMEAGKEVYSKTERQKRRATVKKPAYLLADSTIDSDYEPQPAKAGEFSLSRFPSALCTQSRLFLSPASPSPALTCTFAPLAIPLPPLPPTCTNGLAPPSVSPAAQPLRPPSVSPEAFAALKDRHDEMCAYLCMLGRSHADLITHTCPPPADEAAKGGTAVTKGMFERVEELERRLNYMEEADEQKERQEEANMEETTNGDDGRIAEASSQSRQDDNRRIAELEAHVAGLIATAGTLWDQVEMLLAERKAA
ncbi:proteophosphoglycan ppg4 [Rhodotorula toruloides]|uniref:Proteophosphoglycan ppg4 n=1 Tax=Rhodotorula toruloides TaxID=5286 RepID=A0A511KC75_RHOTO|nr:proteophosphoglycan ppg4 [Rhodotorula toruloides]